MNNTNRILPFLIAITFAPGAFASTYVPCDGCSMSQMQNVARRQGVGRYVVGDIIGNKIEAFRVQSGTHGTLPQRMAPHSISRVAYDNLTSQEIQAFSYYKQFYDAPPAGYKKHFNLTIVPSGASSSVSTGVANRSLSSNGPMAKSMYSGLMPMGSPAPGGAEVSYPASGVNAYTVVNNGPTQNAFLYWLGGLSTYDIHDQSIAAVTAMSVFHITDSSALPELTFTITFTDGSHIGVYVDNTKHPPQLEVDSNTAVDSHGNNIPASADAVAGKGRQEYDFSGNGNGGDEKSMGSQIGAFGIDLPATERYACTSYPGVGGGIETHCVAE